MRTTTFTREWSRLQRRLTALLAATLLGAAMLTPPPAEAASPDGEVGHFLVTTDPDAPATARDLRARGAEHVRALQHTPDTLVVVAPPLAADRIAQARGVTGVERDRVMRIQHHRPDHCGGPAAQQPAHCHDDAPEEPGDTPADGQRTPWGIAHIGAPVAWSTSTGSGARVCVADTGIDRTHEDLDHLAGRNFHTTHPQGRNVDPDAYGDRNGHGTHVAGTIAARDNAVGVVGVAPDAALLVAKVLGDNGSGKISQIIEGLNWCADRGADVINMSFAGGYSDAMQQTVARLAADDVLLVAATGNAGHPTSSYPAAYPEVIAVGATDAEDAVAGFSNRGEELNAPGTDVLSTVPGNAYAYESGTSMASPHVAGVAALLVADHDAASVRSTLRSTATPIADGALRVDAAAAVAN